MISVFHFEYEFEYLGKMDLRPYLLVEKKVMYTTNQTYPQNPSLGHFDFKLVHHYSQFRLRPPFVGPEERKYQQAYNYFQ